ncbi:hypothetical protein pphageT12_31 [Pseudomonas phage pphageT12]|uniref:Uncharacterized protein n=1 Tax=Pseudomonas phage phiB1_1 TaxID=2755402 RepID=A0A7D7IY07_9CAUD|nr:hypothetical protein phiB1_1_22 [Pseudomonas phage phiB1_1]UAW53663.1 hypothetical protein pphageB21_30 [Pseudomonas phage pphageB21]UAW53722.1 hypothetical protein pphageT21_30 [Pseudomonas phage pphageT21]UAW53782.1 hypothetical protein pphageT12_31 [Pseudomonas phage pphageT12]UAW53841.1 hypothetical protein pphageBV72_29 [Pseudomonas phage pphageBV72]
MWIWTRSPRSSIRQYRAVVPCFSTQTARRTGLSRRQRHCPRLCAASYSSC